MTLQELTEILRQYAAGALPLAAVRARLGPVLAADPLNVAESDPGPWDVSHDDERLLWRLIYVLESGGEDSPHLRGRVQRIIASLDSTGSSATTHELLAVIVDQPRFCAIVRKHREGIISRTGFLSVIAESGYPDHVKLWLRHAPMSALEQLCGRLEVGAYDLAAAAFEAPPA